jgi:hypothetical protein
MLLEQVDALCANKPVFTKVQQICISVIYLYNVFFILFCLSNNLALPKLLTSSKQIRSRVCEAFVSMYPTILLKCEKSEHNYAAFQA